MDETKYVFSAFTLFYTHTHTHTLEIDWQQVSSNPQDPSKYSGRSQQCCSLDGLHSPPDFKFTSPLNSPLVTEPRAPITIGIITNFMFHIFFQFPSKVMVLIFLFPLFQVYSVISQYSKFYNFAGSLFLVDYDKVWSSSRD